MGVSEGERKSAEADALSVYARAGQASDVDLVVSAYADGGGLRSPIGNFLFRGEADLRTLMTAVYGVTKHAHFTRSLRDGQTAVLTATSAVWGVKTEEVFVLDLEDDGRIRTNTVHIRPLPGLIVWSLALGIRMARHPGLLWRAWRAWRR